MTETLVLLPGMMCDARLFAPPITALSSRVAIQYSGIDAHDNMQDLANSVLATAPPRFALAGLSMGGIVAMQIIAQAPERVSRLALLDTNPMAETKQIKARRAPQIAKVQAGGLHAVMRDEMKPNYLANGPNRDAILELCMDMATDLGPDVFVRQSIALSTRPDMQDTIRSVKVPTLILCGGEDALCPVQCHELMHDLIPGSTLQLIENAGHLPTLEQPNETTAALAQWLDA